MMGVPKLSEREWVDLSNWTVYRKAQALHGTGAVQRCDWVTPILSGAVSDEAERCQVELNLRSTVFVESRCSCNQVRRDALCAHAIALYLHAAQSEVEHVDSVMEEAGCKDEAETAQPQWPSSLVCAPNKGLQLVPKVVLPPNLLSTLERDAIMIKLELQVGDHNEWIAAEQLDRGRAYRAEPAAGCALAFLESLCGGRLQSLMQLKKSQLLELLRLIGSQPWVADAYDGQPRQWCAGEFPQLYPAVMTQAASAQASVKEPPKAKKVAVTERSKQARHSESLHRAAATEPMCIDGNCDWLAITLPSRNSAVYSEALSLVKNNSFQLDPRSRKWWLRDRHRVLSFLASYYERIEKRLRAEVGPVLQKTLDTIHFAQIDCTTSQRGDDFQLEVHLQAGDADVLAVQQALTQGRSYVDNGKQVVLIDPKEVEQLQRLQSAFDGDAVQLPTARYQRTIRRQDLAYADTILEELPNGWAPPEDWKRKSEALRNLSRLQPAPVPAPLDDRLRMYQRLGVAWMWHLHQLQLGGILADEMGLGKTVQALALIECLRGVAREKHQGVLVVCPAGLMENWRREVQQFTPQLSVWVHHGVRRDKTPDKLQGWDIVITSYTTLANDRELLAELDWVSIIADEAQHIKNRRTRNARALKGLHSTSRFLLTGTPIENSPQDLLSLFEFLLPGYLNPNGSMGGAEDRAGLDERLRHQVAPYILRRSKSLVAPELPEKIEQVIFCPLEGEQFTLYRQYQEQSTREIFDMEMAGASENRIRLATLNQLLRLRQICADPRLIDPQFSANKSAKWRVFRELLEEAVDGGHRMLVFSQFASSLQLLRQDLDAEGWKYAYLDGSTRDRMAEVDRFQQDASIPVFLLSLKAGGTGLNLTAADMVVHLDPWWNPAVEAQATDRAHRIGQKRVVTSIKLIAAETVEEKVLTLQRTKAHLLDELLEASDAISGKLSLDDLKSLLQH